MDERSKFDRDGYLIAGGLLDQSTIQRLTELVDPIYQQWLDEHQSDYLHYQLVNMHSLTSPEYFEGHEQDRLAFFQAITQRKLTDFVQSLFSEQIHFHNTQLFFNPPNTGKLPYWHRDIQYNPIDESVQKAELPNMLSLHLRIPLLPEKGVELIPGTHKRWDTELERKIRLELENHNNSEGLPDSVLIELKPGDALIFSANMIHRGNYRLNTVRKALDLCIGKPHFLTSPYLDERNLPNAEELNLIENNLWFGLAREIAADNARRGGK